MAVDIQIAIENLKLQLSDTIGKVLAQHVLLRELEHDGGEELTQVNASFVLNNSSTLEFLEDLLPEGEEWKRYMYNSATREMSRRMAPYKQSPRKP